MAKESKALSSETSDKKQDPSLRSSWGNKTNDN